MKRLTNCRVQRRSGQGPQEAQRIKYTLSCDQFPRPVAIQPEWVMPQWKDAKRKGMDLRSGLLTDDTLRMSDFRYECIKAALKACDNPGLVVRCPPAHATVAESNRGADVPRRHLGPGNAQVEPCPKYDYGSSDRGP